MFKKVILAIANVLSLGLGFALIGKLKKSLSLVFVAHFIFTLSGLFNVLETFIGMVITYSLIAIVYLYAFCISFDVKEVKLEKPFRNLLIYIPLTFIISFVCVAPVKRFMYYPKKVSSNLTGIIQKGDYIMTSQKDGWTDEFLYIFWSKDKSKIGQKLNIKLPAEYRKQ
ncbi:MAG: hypothetical protein R3Y43_08215 [Alphaproteobacteria bacterium]